MSAGDKLAAYAAGVGELDAGSLVAGLYLVGSHALGDVRPNSDMDFLGVLGRSPEPDELAALRALHERLRETWPAPHLDGTYVRAGDLCRPADSATPVLRYLLGEEVEAAGSGVTPVEWLTLRTRGVRLIGAPIAELDVAVDDEAVRAYCRRNLAEYPWPQTERLAELAGEASLVTWVADRVEWIALGVPRLLATIETGQVLSKTEAGRYALDRFPEWRAVLEASLKQRLDPRPERIPVLAGMAPDVVAFGRRCIESPSATLAG